MDEGNTLNTDVVLKTILKKNHLRTGNGHPDEEYIESIYDYWFQYTKKKAM